MAFVVNGERNKGLIEDKNLTWDSCGIYDRLATRRQ